MDSQTLMILGIAVVAVVALAAWFYVRQQRTALLKQRFGPEYDRTVENVGATSKAERILEQRAARMQRFELHPLTPEQATEFSQEWRRVQARFVDDPHAAVGEADRLVNQVMAARGYPMEDFDRRADDLSVDHPHVVENYRTARRLVQRRDRGEAGTEEMRQALVNYRTLFDDLLAGQESERRRAS